MRKAVMEIIGKKGFAGVTSRNIGMYLGLKNVSLVNYYFGSKENLILETLKNNYFEVMNSVYEFMDCSVQAVDKLKALFGKQMDLFWEYPALIPLFYFQEIKKIDLVQFEYKEELLSLQDKIIRRNLSLLMDVTGIQDEKEAYLKLFQMRGSIMFPSLARDTVPWMQSHFSSPDNRIKYVESIINTGQF